METNIPRRLLLIVAACFGGLPGSAARRLAPVRLNGIVSKSFGLSSAGIGLTDTFSFVNDESRHGIQCGNGISGMLCRLRGGSSEEPRTPPKSSRSVQVSPAKAPFSPMSPGSLLSTDDEGKERIIAKLSNNVKSIGMTVEEMRARLAQLEAARRSGWKLHPTVIRFPTKDAPPQKVKEIGVLGTWTDWLEVHPLIVSKDGQFWEAEIELPAGKHAFKFYQDQRWRLSSLYQTEDDFVRTSGNNIIVVAENTEDDVAQMTADIAELQRAIADKEDQEMFAEERSDLSRIQAEEAERRQRQAEMDAELLRLQAENDAEAKRQLLAKMEVEKQRRQEADREADRLRRLQAEKDAELKHRRAADKAAEEARRLAAEKEAAQRRKLEADREAELQRRMDAEEDAERQRRLKAEADAEAERLRKERDQAAEAAAEAERARKAREAAAATELKGMKGQLSAAEEERQRLADQLVASLRDFDGLRKEVSLQLGRLRDSERALEALRADACRRDQMLACYYGSAVRNRVHEGGLADEAEALLSTLQASEAEARRVHASLTSRVSEEEALRAATGEFVASANGTLFTEAAAGEVFVAEALPTLSRRQLEASRAHLEPAGSGLRAAAAQMEGLERDVQQLTRELPAETDAHARASGQAGQAVAAEYSATAEAVRDAMGHSRAVVLAATADLAERVRAAEQRLRQGMASASDRLVSVGAGVPEPEGGKKASIPSAASAAAAAGGGGTVSVPVLPEAFPSAVRAAEVEAAQALREAVLSLERARAALKRQEGTVRGAEAELVRLGEVEAAMQAALNASQAQTEREGLALVADLETQRDALAAAIRGDVGGELGAGVLDLIARARRLAKTESDAVLALLKTQDAAARSAVEAQRNSIGQAAHLRTLAQSRSLVTSSTKELAALLKTQGEALEQALKKQNLADEGKATSGLVDTLRVTVSMLGSKQDVLLRAQRAGLDDALRLANATSAAEQRLRLQLDGAAENLRGDLSDQGKALARQEGDASTLQQRLRALADARKDAGAAETELAAKGPRQIQEVVRQHRERVNGLLDGADVGDEAGREKRMRSVLGGHGAAQAELIAALRNNTQELLGLAAAQQLELRQQGDELDRLRQQSKAAVISQRELHAKAIPNITARLECALREQFAVLVGTLEADGAAAATMEAGLQSRNVGLLTRASDLHSRIGACGAVSLKRASQAGLAAEGAVGKAMARTVALEEGGLAMHRGLMMVDRLAAQHHVDMEGQISRSGAELDKGIAHCIAAQGRLTDANTEARAAAAELSRRAAQAHAAALGSAAALSDGALGLRAAAEEAMRLNADITAAAARANNLTLATAHGLWDEAKGAADLRGSLAELLRNASDLGACARLGVERLDTGADRLGEALRRETDQWGAAARGAVERMEGAAAQGTEVAHAVEGGRGRMELLLSEGQEGVQKTIFVERGNQRQIQAATTAVGEAAARARRSTEAASSRSRALGADLDRLARGAKAACEGTAAARVDNGEVREQLDRADCMVAEAAVPALARRVELGDKQTIAASDALDALRDALAAASAAAGVIPASTTSASAAAAAAGGRLLLATGPGATGAAEAAARRHGAEAARNLSALAGDVEDLLAAGGRSLRGEVGKIADQWAAEARGQRDRLEAIKARARAALAQSAAATAAVNSSLADGARAAAVGLDTLAQAAATRAASAAAAARRVGVQVGAHGVRAGVGRPVEPAGPLAEASYQPRLARVGPQEEYIVESFRAAAAAAGYPHAATAEAKAGGGKGLEKLSQKTSATNSAPSPLVTAAMSVGDKAAAAAEAALRKAAAAVSTESDVTPGGTPVKRGKLVAAHVPVTAAPAAAAVSSSTRRAGTALRGGRDAEDGAEPSAP